MFVTTVTDSPALLKRCFVNSNACRRNLFAARKSAGDSTRHDAFDFVPAHLKLAADFGLVGVSQPINHNALEERREVRTAISPRRIDLHHAVLRAFHARHIGDKKCFVLTTVKMPPLAPPRVVARAGLAASRATRFAAKLDDHLNGQSRVVNGDQGNDPRLMYAQDFFVEISVVHPRKLAARR